MPVRSRKSTVPQADPLGPSSRRALLGVVVAVHAAAAVFLARSEPPAGESGRGQPRVMNFLALPVAEVVRPPVPTPVEPRVTTPRKVVAVAERREPSLADFQVPQTEIPPTEPAAVEQLAVVPANVSALPAPPAARTVSITSVEYLVEPVLDYPLASRRLGEQGVVQVSVLVDARGRPEDMQVLRSSGYPRLDEAALDTVRATRFRPYTEDGVARPFRVVMPLVFELEQ